MLTAFTARLAGVAPLLADLQRDSFYRDGEVLWWHPAGASDRRPRLARRGAAQPRAAARRVAADPARGRHPMPYMLPPDGRSCPSSNSTVPTGRPRRPPLPGGTSGDPGAPVRCLQILLHAVAALPLWAACRVTTSAAASVADLRGLPPHERPPAIPPLPPRAYSDTVKLLPTVAVGGRGGGADPAGGASRCAAAGAAALTAESSGGRAPLGSVSAGAAGPEAAR